MRSFLPQVCRGVKRLDLARGLQVDSQKEQRESNSDPGQDKPAVQSLATNHEKTTDGEKRQSHSIDIGKP